MIPAIGEDHKWSEWIVIKPGRKEKVIQAHRAEERQKTLRADKTGEEIQRHQISRYAQ